MVRTRTAADLIVARSTQERRGNSDRLINDNNVVAQAAVGINRIYRIQAIAVLRRLAKTDDRELARIVFVDSDPLVVVLAMARLPQAGKRPWPLTWNASPTSTSKCS